MGFDELTPEQKAKARSCKTPEELLDLAKEEGYVLSDAELQDVSCGAWKFRSYSEECESLSCQGYYCHFLYCYQVSCRNLSCGDYDYDTTY